MSPENGDGDGGGEAASFASLVTGAILMQLVPLPGASGELRAGRPSTDQEAQQRATEGSGLTLDATGSSGPGGVRYVGVGRGSPVGYLGGR